MRVLPGRREDQDVPSLRFDVLGVGCAEQGAAALEVVVEIKEEGKKPFR